MAMGFTAPNGPRRTPGDATPPAAPAALPLPAPHSIPDTSLEVSVIPDLSASPNADTNSVVPALAVSSDTVVVEELFEDLLQSSLNEDVHGMPDLGKSEPLPSMEIEAGSEFQAEPAPFKDACSVVPPHATPSKDAGTEADGDKVMPQVAPDAGTEADGDKVMPQVAPSKDAGSEDDAVATTPSKEAGSEGDAAMPEAATGQQSEEGDHATAKPLEGGTTNTFAAMMRADRTNPPQSLLAHIKHI